MKQNDDQVKEYKKQEIWGNMQKPATSMPGIKQDPGLHHNTYAHTLRLRLGKNNKDRTTNTATISPSPR